MGKRYIIQFSLGLIILLTVTSTSADEGSFSLCSERAYRLKYDQVLNKIIITCYDDELDTPFHLINPLTLSIIKSCQLNGSVWQVNGLNSANSLLVCMGEYDGVWDTKEGKLLEIDYSSGNMINELIYDQELVHMTIDNLSVNAYITTIGRKYENNPNQIIKIDLEAFQVVDEVEFGEFTSSIKILPDGSKLYVDSANVFPELSESHSRWGIGVFDTSDMTLISRIVLDSPASYLEMSYDGSELYVTSGYVGTSEETGASMYIIDTDTDQITETLHFTYNGAKCETGSLAYDCDSETLYCTAQPRVGEIYPSSNLIVAVDLSDYSYSFFTMGENSIYKIALAPLACGSRLFAIESDSPVVYWRDL